jgi:FecR protein
MGTKTLSVILLWLALSPLLPCQGTAAVVGHFSQVEGKVDLLKKGQLPATPAKLNDEVEPGDILRTKSLSKAQITFVDDSVLTISPGSRIAIEEYMVDAAKGKCNAVLQLFQGIALAVLSKIYQSEQPNFIIKTHTAIMRIRGIEVGISLHPNSSTFLNFSGRTTVSSIFPGVQGTVELLNNQGTSVERSLPPTLAFELKAEDREQFMRQLATGLITRLRGKETGLSTSDSGGLPSEQVARDYAPFGIRVVTPRLLFVAPVTPVTSVEGTKSDEVALGGKGVLPGSGVGSSPPGSGVGSSPPAKCPLEGKVDCLEQGKLPATPAKPR